MGVGVVLLIALIVIAWVSLEGREDSIIGRWELEYREYVVDDETVRDYGDHIILEFNEDGTGTESQNGDEMEFRWEEVGDDTLRIITDNETVEREYQIGEDHLVFVNQINEIRFESYYKRI